MSILAADDNGGAGRDDDDCDGDGDSDGEETEAATTLTAADSPATIFARLFRGAFVEEQNTPAVDTPGALNDSLVVWSTDAAMPLVVSFSLQLVQTYFIYILDHEISNKH